MKFLNLVQGSEEWLAARLKHFTASEAPAMMGESKYFSRNQLLDHKKGWITVIDEYTQKIFNEGHAAEESMRNILEMESFSIMPAVVGVLEVGGLPLLASLDGYLESVNEPWEHKLWNKTLSENVLNNVLEPHYYWQLEHQLLVCGGTRAKFTCSDGTEDNAVHMYYESVPERRERLIAGWKQFAIDLENHELEAKVEKVIPQETTALPVLSCIVTGNEIASNAYEYLEVISRLAADEMNRELVTEQDFTDKELLNKNVKKARAEIKAKVEEVRGQFVTFNDFEGFASKIDSVLQKMQSHGEKQVKTAKEAKKELMFNSVATQLTEHVNELNSEINPLTISLPAIDWRQFIKGKSSFTSMQDALDSALANAKLDASVLAEEYRVKLDIMEDIANGFEFLFNDLQQLVTANTLESLEIVAKNRIFEYNKQQEEIAEQKRQQELQQQEQLRQQQQEAAAYNNQQAIDEAIVAPSNSEPESNIIPTSKDAPAFSQSTDLMSLAEKLLSESGQLIERLLNKELSEAEADVDAVAGCMDKERKEERLARAQIAKKQFSNFAHSIRFDFTDKAA